MAMAAGLYGCMAGDSGLLRQAGQSVVFAHEGDHGPAFARLADHGSGNIGDALGDAEALMRQLGLMLRAGARLGVADLGHAPDPVAQRDQPLLVRIDVAPEIVSVVHDGPALVRPAYDQGGPVPSSRQTHGGRDFPMPSCAALASLARR